MQAAGTFEKAPKQGFRRIFGYFGASSTWSIGLFLFFFYFVAAISFLTDAVLRGKFDLVWLLVSGAGFLPPLAIALGYRFAFLNRRRERSRPILNLLVAALAGASRNVSVGLFALWTELDTTQLWAFRFYGGAILGVAVFMLWALINGAKIEYLSSLRRLSETQNDLSSSRAHMPAQLAQINQKLQERTRDAILPQLSAIKELLGNALNAQTAVEILRHTITDQIRPMMKEISEDQPKPFESKNLRKLRQVSAALPDRFTLRDKLSVTWSAVISLLGIALWLIIFQSQNGVLDILGIFVAYFFTLSVAKLFTPKALAFRRDIAIALTLLYSLFASVAIIVYIYYVLDPDLLPFLTYAGFAIISGMSAPVMLLQVSVRAEKRHQVENQVTDDLLAIAKENSLYEQRLWVFRKRWLLVLHGNVQSSLTAALTRLQSAPQVDAVVLEMVKQDLRRAEEAVDANLKENINLEVGLKQLQELWSGICEVTVSISERASRALLRSHDTSFCVNEIVKEAVSNAVRHGEATAANIVVDRISDDMLQIEVSNNGTPPKHVPNQGIGSEMLNEICLNWELLHDRKSVRLVAELPVKL